MIIKINHTILLNTSYLIKKQIMDKAKQTEFVPCTDIMRKYIKMMEQKLCTDSEEYISSAHARREKIKCSEGKLHSYERFINWDNENDPNIKQMFAKKMDK